MNKYQKSIVNQAKWCHKGKKTKSLKWWIRFIKKRNKTLGLKPIV